MLKPIDPVTIALDNYLDLIARGWEPETCLRQLRKQLSKIINDLNRKINA